MDFIKENWELIKDTIRMEYELSDVSYNTWVKPLNFHSIKDDTVIIMIPSDQAHALNYISSKYKSYFKVTVSEMANHTYDISFILESDAGQEMLTSPGSVYNINYENANLNSKYRFDTFVVGNNNKFAHSASLAVAELHFSRSAQMGDRISFLLPAHSDRRLSGSGEECVASSSHLFMDEKITCATGFVKQVGGKKQREYKGKTIPGEIQGKYNIRGGKREKQA